MSPLISGLNLFSETAMTRATEMFGIACMPASNAACNAMYKSPEILQW